MNIDNVWRKYENFEVSDEGNIRKKLKSGKYHYYSVFRKNTRKTTMLVKINGVDRNVRRIVWEAFNGPIPEGYLVVSKNGATFCGIYDLELITKQQLGERTGARAKAKPVIDYKNKKIYRSAREAARHLPASRQMIADICNGKSFDPFIDVRWYKERRE